jgi:putative two-component system response regulator
MEVALKYQDMNVQEKPHKTQKILVVDDEPGIRRLLRQRLAGEGYQCKEAGTTEQILNTLETDSIALVVLDIRMPGKSGIELLPQIKSGYPDTSVIMATAINEINVAVQWSEAWG